MSGMRGLVCGYWTGCVLLAVKDTHAARLHVQRAPSSVIDYDVVHSG